MARSSNITVLWHPPAGKDKERERSVESVSQRATTPRATINGNLVTAFPIADRGDVIYLAYLLLPMRAFMAFGRVLGWVAMLVKPRSRRAVRANLEQAFGPAKSRGEFARLTRQAFEFSHIRQLLVQVATLMAARGTLETYFPIQDIENLDGAIALGKGAIVIGSHVNSLGLILAVLQLRQRGYDVRCPLPGDRDPWPQTPFRRFVNLLYGAPPSLAVAIGAFHSQFNVRPLINLLNEKVVLMVSGDGLHSAAFADVDFLGRRLPFTSGAISLAQVARCPVVPAFTVGAAHHLHFEFEPFFVVDRAGAAADEIDRKVTQFIGRVEQRLLADIPSWQYWFVEDVFSVFGRWRVRTIRERYAM